MLTRRLAIAVLVFAVLTGCRDKSLSDTSSGAYRDAVSAFYTGLAAMEVGADAHAEAELLRVTRLSAQEPASWANLGLLALRRNEFDAAAERLGRAESLAPQNSSIQLLLALLASNRGQLDDGIARLRRAITMDSTSLKAMYALAQEIERRGDENSDAEIQLWLDRILSANPDNMAVLIETARLAARRNDAERLAGSVSQLMELTPTWPLEVREQLDLLREALSASDYRGATTQVAFLRNVLLTFPAYRQDLAEVQTPASLIGEPIQRFIRLPSPSATPAPADAALHYATETLIPSDSTAWAWIGALTLNGEGAPRVLVANGNAIRVVGGTGLAFPGGPSAQPPGPAGITSLDFNYDFRMDLALAGADGFRLFAQQPSGDFVDVTPQTGLPTSITRSPYTAVWAADLDLEGDMDVVLGAPAGPPRILQNNGDGTFSPLRLFDGIDGLVGFVWADLDADGDPDVALLDGASTLQVFANERGGRFVEQSLPQELDAVHGVGAMDADGDGVIDVILIQEGGYIQRLSRPGADQAPESASWTLRELARWPDFAGESDGGPLRIFAADLDNNGALDLVVSGPRNSRIWLSDGSDTYIPLETQIEAHIFDIAALNQDGRLDLLGLSRAGRPLVMQARPTVTYNWTQLRPRAAQSAGDQRINSFGIGGEVELRSGLLFQKQRITRPIVHFGLGDNVTAEVARIIWPNGIVQAEFDLLRDATVQAVQRLKGSCPWVFTYDGTTMRFVTDFLWRSPLGLRINAQETAGLTSTEDWVRIRGDQLVARDGYYDLRITAELWETHFFDHVSLMIVDHREETELFIDERFAFPPPPLVLNVTEALRPVTRAWDDRGQDVTEVVAARDERYLDSFGRGRYQGVTRNHYVEVELGDDAPHTGPLWLVASGWIRPTDSSINVALSQGKHEPPMGLSLEVPDGGGGGGWVTVNENLGFPAGKSKTVLIDLQRTFRAGGARRLRLRTNLEIYWDQIAWAAGARNDQITMSRIAPSTADLRYRGFSEVHEADRSSPEYPTYDRLAGTAARWRDLIGYHTRHGDVRELLDEIDDRYVIMNAGDEMAFRFPAPPPPPDGWSRDFVLIGDGWVKDGDYNTASSKTVLPLPSHDRPEYTARPGRLVDDPVFLRHSQDWHKYHTRFVTPEQFQNALIPSSGTP